MTAIDTALADATPKSSFRQDTIDVVTRLRSAMVEAFGFADVQKSRDIQKRFDVSLNISWQVYRMINSADPLELCPHIPAPTPMRKLLRALRSRGCNAATVDAVETAYADFEKHVICSAGDRPSFDAMIGRLIGGETEAQIEFVHRRSVFEAYRYLLGIEQNANVITFIKHPSDTSLTTFDVANLHISRQLRRLNPDSPLLVDIRPNVMSAAPRVPSLPLDVKTFEKHGFPILPAFCSTSELALKRTETPDGAVITEWLGNTVGQDSMIDLAFGDVQRGIPFAKRVDHQLQWQLLHYYFRPTHVDIRDFLVHRPTFGRMTGEVSRRGRVTERVPLEMLDAKRIPHLPCHDRLTYLGGGASAAYTPEVPQYVNLLKYACKTLGWNLEDFDVYRIRTEYPLMDTVTVASYTLPLL